MVSKLFTPLSLPNGQIVPNRLCKAAMEENMAESGQIPGQALWRLYQQWAEGGAGLILTGNVMVDPKALTGPGGVVLTADSFRTPELEDRFRRWAEISKSGGGLAYMQISHPGRQVYATQGTPPVSASQTRVTLPGPAQKMFIPARALEEDEILVLVERFAQTAQQAEKAGFDGIQIHAAHGYLVMQFLSPLTNLRQDQWGGSPENRVRFLLQIIRAIRARVRPEFGVAVKLNSADFQQGGFQPEAARQVVEWLGAEAVDFVELSGGSYESAAMMGLAPAQSTQKREVYFLDFAKMITEVALMPLMVTGGVRRYESAQAVMDEGVDLVGIARAMAYAPHLPKDWQAGQNSRISVAQAKWKNKALCGLANMAMAKAQLYHYAAGRAGQLKPRPLWALIRQNRRQKQQTRRYRRWLQAQGLL